VSMRIQQVNGRCPCRACQGLTAGRAATARAPRWSLLAKIRAFLARKRD
jgi:hypothetical protein